MDKKLEQYKDYIESNSEVKVGVNLDLSSEMNILIPNDEIPSSEVDLFGNENHSKIAMDILKS